MTAPGAGGGSTKRGLGKRKSRGDVPLSGGTTYLPRRQKHARGQPATMGRAARVYQARGEAGGGVLPEEAERSAGMPGQRRARGPSKEGTARSIGVRAGSRYTPTSGGGAQNGAVTCDKSPGRPVEVPASPCAGLGGIKDPGEVGMGDEQERAGALGTDDGNRLHRDGCRQAAHLQGPLPDVPGGVSPAEEGMPLRDSTLRLQCAEGALQEAGGLPLPSGPAGEECQMAAPRPRALVHGQGGRGGSQSDGTVAWCEEGGGDRQGTLLEPAAQGGVADLGTLGMAAVASVPTDRGERGKDRGTAAEGPTEEQQEVADAIVDALLKCQGAAIEPDAGKVTEEAAMAPARVYEVAGRSPGAPDLQRVVPPRAGGRPVPAARLLSRAKLKASRHAKSGQPHSGGLPTLLCASAAMARGYIGRSLAAELFALQEYEEAANGGPQGRTTHFLARRGAMPAAIPEVAAASKRKGNVLCPEPPPRASAAEGPDLTASSGAQGGEADSSAALRAEPESCKDNNHATPSPFCEVPAHRAPATLGSLLQEAAERLPTLCGNKQEVAEPGGVWAAGGGDGSLQADGSKDWAAGVGASPGSGGGHKSTAVTPGHAHTAFASPATAMGAMVSGTAQETVVCGPRVEVGSMAWSVVHAAGGGTNSRPEVQPTTHGFPPEQRESELAAGSAACKDLKKDASEMQFDRDGVDEDETDLESL